MKSKLKLFFFIILLTLCAEQAPLTLLPLPYEGQNWILLRKGVVASGGKSGKKSADLPPVDEVLPGQAKLAHDPETPSISIFFPAEALIEPVEVRAYFGYPPEGISALPTTVGTPFYFGAWILGEGRTVEQFETSVVLNVPYDESFLQGTSEELLKLYMYKPGINSWVKLCGRVDSASNVVTGLVQAPTAIEAGGNTLFAIGVDDSASLESLLDGHGKTFLTIPDANLILSVPPGAVDVGTHFEVTSSPIVPDLRTATLLSKPVNAKACKIDHENHENSRQVFYFRKPIDIELTYSPKVALSVGGAQNLTIATIDDRDWKNMEKLGYPIKRSTNSARVKADILGAFSLATR